MPASNPFAQLVPNRLRAVIPRVQRLVWGPARPVPVEVTEPTVEHLALEQARVRPLRPAVSGEHWGKLWDQRWARLDLSAAEPGDFLQWGDQGESTLHLDGRPHFGFDPEHRHAPLPSGVREAWVENYCCRTQWSPDGFLSAQGARYDGASLVRRNDEAWHAFHDLKCLADLVFFLRDDRAVGTGAGMDTAYHYPAVDNASPLYRQLLGHLDRAMDAFETGGIAAMRPLLAATYDDLRDASPRIQGRLWGNSHLDLVYLWPEHMGEAKAVHTFATVERLMELYPEFKFSYSQPASYAAVARRSPVLAERVRQRLAEGRWQATGALLVESDLLIACGEGLARSFALGQREFAKLRPDGSPARLLWLPDCFGFPACMPQLMRLAGVDWFFSVKLTWSAINRQPHTSYTWKGNDGSMVLAHVPRSAGYANTVEPARIHSAAQSHMQADLHREFAHPVGFGDGGGGPTAEMCERARRYARLAGLPPLSWDQPEDFFARLAPLQPRLPVWQGELYLEYHRGTYTTHGAVKAAFRALERALQVREAVAVATGASPDASLDAAWRRMVFHQFHDDIPGTSVPEVYAEGLADLEKHRAAQDAAARSTLAATAAAGSAPLPCIFNPLPQPWVGWIEPTPGAAPLHITLPPLTGLALADASAHTAPTPARATASSLENERVRVRLESDGALAELVIDGRALELLPGAGRPVLYPDLPANYDAWDIDRHTLDLGQPLATPAEVTVESASGPRAVVAVARAVGKASRLVTRYILEAGAAVLRVELELDWAEPQSLLKLPFPTGYLGRMARFGAPFGSTLRNQQSGSPEAEAQWEVPASRWAAVAHDGEREGLLLVTEAKYGFSCRDGELAVSLVRSPLQTGHQGHGILTPRALARHQSPSPYSDLGRHHIRLALGRHDLAAPRAEQGAALADTLFTPPLVYTGAPVPGPLLDIEGGETLVPSWAAPEPGGRWTLRLHETAGQSGEARLRLAPGARATPVDLLDRERGPALVDGRLHFRPYEIVSLRVHVS